MAITVQSLMFGPLWLESARRLHNIVLLGITSARETLRLAYGKEMAFLYRMVRRDSSASGTPSWVSDIMSRRRAVLTQDGSDPEPGEAPPGPRGRPS